MKVAFEFKFARRKNGVRLCLFFMLLSGSIIVNAQKKITITGTVTDTLNAPIASVSIGQEKSGTAGTTTDANGRFIIDVEPGTILGFSFIGFEPYAYRVPNAPQQNLSIVLRQKVIAAGEEVVVTALGRKQIKESIVGSVSTIKPENLKIPASNLTNALVGQVAGVIGFQSSGQPGLDNSDFFIRGVTTFGYRADPMILIDNIEVGKDDLARLNVNDLESFTILKDASATTLYGARGANGVILVTTKSGKTGKAILNIVLENTVSTPTDRIKLADPITYMNMYNEATVTRDPMMPAPFSADKIHYTGLTLQNAPAGNRYVYPAVDWLNLLFRDRTFTQRANMNVSGGSDLSHYFISGSYSNDNGILKDHPDNNFKTNLKFTTYQLRTNVDFNLTKSTQLSAQLWGLFNEYSGPLTNNASFSTDLYDMATHTSPVLFPAYYEPDSANLLTQHILFGNAYGSSANSVGYLNPYAQLLRGFKKFSNSRMTATLRLNQKLDFIVRGLSFDGFVNVNRYAYFDNTMAYNPFYYTIPVGGYNIGSNRYVLQWINSLSSGNAFAGGIGAGGNGSAATEYLVYSPGKKDATAYVHFQGRLDYSKRLGDHDIGATLNIIRMQRLEANGIDPVTSQPSLPYALPYRNLNFAGEASYAFRSKYFLRFNFAYNGSERFDVNNRYGFFPTIGASWIVSKEKFWQDGLSDIISSLKLRSSIGYSGNDQIGSQRFFYLSDVNLAGGNPASFGIGNGYSRPGVTIRNYQNSQVTWERGLRFNGAVEATFFRSLDLIAEYWKERRSNILQQRLIPSSEGLEAGVFTNVGEVESNGWDLTLNYNKSFSKDLTVAYMSNFTYSQAVYNNYEEPAYLSEPWRRKTGSIVGQPFGYIAERLFVDDKEAATSPVQNFGGQKPKGGDIKYRDVNGDGQITIADMVPIGLPTTPQISYGFGASAKYRSFDLGFRFQGNARTTFMIDARGISPFVIPADGVPGQAQVLQAVADDYWSEDNQNIYAFYPRLGTDANIITNNLQPSTWWLRKGDFLRLKLVELGYTLSPAIARRARITNLRIYVNGSNLFLLSNFKLWDAEQKNGFTYPLQKTYNLGLNVTF
ncbi:SusC/RagA family TonB-linked outer membrane protein [Niabella drilacis]|uniref:TonB-linked outer membrane protein, SusC/RagA family n=1 Tax=Niabella drilacis (strain DSM 25811 / CCM 8410 / CCUG 62505 / LMG 26954 / E90) TaxID=1285928 RepID=A0A1G6RJA4_NIADE|nr:TonB-dependent receptor [Niabella drilacis]SDD04493.1 TonB-linked outer membrane protein, SusC/RagA family [Niabella drilacis]